MNTPISYYGGKQNLANKIIELLPSHQQYVEPFFGGGAILFGKPPSPHEVINDISDIVINFYEVLQLQYDELEKLIKCTLVSESQHRRAKDILKNKIEATNVERAWAFFMQTNMSFGKSLYAGFAFANDNSIVKLLYNKVNNFTNKYSERLRQVEIFCRDALDIIKLKDGTETFFYCDPPYVTSDKGHYRDYTMEDFINLLELLSTIKGKFLLSSYPEDVLFEYRRKYNWYSKDFADIPVAISGHIDKMKTECLTFNYQLEDNLFNH